jgi:hypothetical protein
MLNLDVLAIPFLSVIGVTAFYALLMRWLFRRRLTIGLAAAALFGTAGLVALALALFALAGWETSFVPLLLKDLQAATTLQGMIHLALIYAALPEEAAKIGIVVLLLVLFGGKARQRSDPAEMLLYAALGFALCESLLYVVGFSKMPDFQDHLIVFAVARGLFGGLLHGLLALVAGFCLARFWNSGARWLGLLLAYGVAVVLHASFDGSLLHLVFRNLAQTQAETGLPGAGGETGAGLGALVLGLSFLTLLILAILGLVRSRRLTN